MLIQIDNTNKYSITVEPVDLFFRKAHKNKFYLKGQIHFIANKNNHDLSLDVYQLKVISMVRKKYLKILGKTNKWTPLDSLISIHPGKPIFIITKEQQEEYFLPFYNSQKKEGLTENGKNIEDAVWGPTIEQDKSQYSKILKTTYAENIIKDGHDISILQLHLKYLASLPAESAKISRDDYRIHRLLVRKFSEDQTWEDEKLNKLGRSVDLFGIYKLAHSMPSDKLMKIGEYKNLLKSISKMAKKWENEKALSESFLKKLRELYCEFKPFIDTGKQMKTLLQKKKDHYEPLREFCFLFLDDLFEDIKNSGVVSRCRCCGNLFIPNRNRDKEHCDSYCTKNRKRLKTLFSFE